MKKISRLAYMSILFVVAIVLSACVDQHPDKTKKTDTSSKTIENRIIATSVAAAELTDILGLDLVGVADTQVSKLPDRYENVKRVGLPMGPDIEILKSLRPTMIYSPSSLKADLEIKYKDASLPYKFLNLSSVDGLYESMDIIAKDCKKTDISEKKKEEHDKFISDLQERIKDKKKPTVLVLMGLPGSFVIATNKSYVGNLVELAGGKLIFTDDVEEFLPVNTEELVKQNPDIILRTAHTMPEDVMAQFEEEFNTNDIWKHFDAVKNKKVYNLEHTHFGMSANMNYMEALDKLEEMFYEK